MRRSLQARGRVPPDRPQRAIVALGAPRPSMAGAGGPTQGKGGKNAAALALLKTAPCLPVANGAMSPRKPPFRSPFRLPILPRRGLFGPRGYAPRLCLSMRHSPSDRLFNGAAILAPFFLLRPSAASLPQACPTAGLIFLSVRSSGQRPGSCGRCSGLTLKLLISNLVLLTASRSVVPVVFALRRTRRPAFSPMISCQIDPY